MKQRLLGKLQSSALGLGCMGMSEFYGNTDRKEAISVIQYAFEHGITMLDTADIYGAGENEKLVGEALKSIRYKAIIATKFGILRDPKYPLYRGINGRPEYVRRSCEQSLKNLGTDYIDLYYLHRVDPTVPIEETVGAMSELVAEGKVRYIGLSEASAKTIRRANAIHPISAIQAEYSMGTREVEANEVLETTQALNIGFVAYSPLCRALLTNQLNGEFEENDVRKYFPRFNKDNIIENQKLTKGLAEIAANRGCTLAQLSLAWLLDQAENIVPIPGTKQLKYLKENITAASLYLKDADKADINNILNQFKLVGERYPSEILSTLDG